MIRKILKLCQIFQKKYFLDALLTHHVAASVEHSNIFRLLATRNIKTIVDIGANRGQFALVSRYHLPQAKIISFEPLNAPSIIFRSLFKSDSLTTLHEIALGSIQQEMTIHVSKADDSSSLLPISEKQVQLFPGTEEKEVRSVNVAPLQEVLSSHDIIHPAFLKIDVQGFELKVLQGSELLLPYFDNVYVECSFIELYQGQALAWQVIEFLQEKKFFLCGVYNVSYDKKGLAVQGDFLFKNNREIYI